MRRKVVIASVAMMSSALSAHAANERLQGSLAFIELSPTHSVDLLEFEAGVPVIVERRSADKDQQRITIDNGRSLSDAFKALRPNEAIPKALRDADQRGLSQAKRARTVAEPLESSTGRASDPKARQEPGAPPPTQPNTTLRGNWTDWTSDGQWFLQTYCNMGQQRWCPVNVNGWAYSGAKYNTTWFQATGFAQGFNSTAHFWVQYRSCGWWSCKWKIPSANGVFTLQPRTLVTITWTTNGSRWAGIDQSSDRVGLAALWNTAGAPSGPTSNAGPCNDPGELCCSSYDSWGGASSYCNGSVTCSSGMCVTP